MSNQLDSDREPTGTEGLPTPTFSTGPGAQPNSGGDVVDINQTVATLKAELEALKKQQQSAKDKEFSNLRKEIADIRGNLTVLDEYRQMVKSGMSEGEAVSELRLRSLEAAIGQPAEKPAPASTQRQGMDMRAVMDDTLEMLSEAGLSTNTPGAMDIIKGHYDSPEQYYKAVAKFVARAGKPQATQPVSLAGVSGGSANSSTTSSISAEDADKMFSEYNSLARMPSQNKARLDAIKKDLIAAGYW